MLEKYICIIHTVAIINDVATECMNNIFIKLKDLIRFVKDLLLNKKKITVITRYNGTKQGFQIFTIDFIS